MHIPNGAPKGTVKVWVVIDPTGNIIKDSVKIIQSLCKSCDWEALRVIKKCPKWNPGESESNEHVVVPIIFN